MRFTILVTALALLGTAAAQIGNPGLMRSTRASMKTAFRFHTSPIPTTGSSPCWWAKGGR